ncbi:response regulator [Synechococcus sp. RSCCF101]|uniref:response regulator transcription factor n=1 Tax=Synechococcus sp. RSCCF101 TaxID=2511069 RepID=UPI0012476AD5|nr:response regulator [Synechococcus sp. RSCCF101]QEY30909.1 response regulator [Synechococcus sp. RSCCF101]
MTKTVLVIDDDASVRKAFALSLSDEADLEVVLAASGEEGLAAARSRQPCLIYLDLRMPGMNGVETLRQLRRQGYSGRVYIVTAFHKEFFQDLAAARSEQISFDLVMKPLERDQIISITRAIVDQATTVLPPS